MLVRDIMTSPALTVGGESTLEGACHIMHEHNIRHLPVLEDGRLVGIITDRDLGGSSSSFCVAPAAPRGLVREAMTQPVRTASADDPVEDAARVMRELKIGCLPVVEDERLVGIVTGIDLLDALLRLTGVHRPGGRLEIRLQDRPGELGRLMTLFGERRVNTHSVLTHPEEGGAVRVVLRVGTLETRPLANTLREMGFEVVWPPEKPWQE